MPSKICHLFRNLASSTEWNQWFILYACPPALFAQRSTRILRLSRRKSSNFASANLILVEQLTSIQYLTPVCGNHAPLRRRLPGQPLELLHPRGILTVDSNRPSSRPLTNGFVRAKSRFSYDLQPTTFFYKTNPVPKSNIPGFCVTRPADLAVRRAGEDAAARHRRLSRASARQHLEPPHRPSSARPQLRPVRRHHRRRQAARSRLPRRTVPGRSHSHPVRCRQQSACGSNRVHGLR